MQNKLPKEWKWVKLVEVSEINPKLQNKDKFPKEMEVQFLPMKLVEAVINKIHLTETRKIEEVLKGSYTPFVDGDVIFAKVTPCMENGKIAIVNKLKNAIGFGSSEFHVVRAKEQILNKYLFHFIIQDRFRNEAANVMTGAVGLRRVPKQFLENSFIPLPPLETQQTIVAKIEELFSELDKGIEDLKTAQQQLKTYRQSVLKWAFEGKLTNENVKEGELPKGWEKVSINVVSNINPKLPNKENLDREMEVQFLPMKLVEEIVNKIHLSDIKKLHEVLKGSYTPFIDNDIIFAKVTPCMENGKIAIVEKLKNGIGFGSSEFHVIRTNEKVINKFMFYFLVQDRFRNEAANEMTGAVGLRRVPKQFIENYQIPIPSSEEQHRIVQEIESRLSVADKMEESIAQSLQQAEALRQSILKKAFSGELV